MVQTRRAKQTLRDKQGTKDVVSQLPHELALKILSFASADAVVAACGVAKHWRDLGGTQGRKRVIQRRFNVSVPRARVSEPAPTLRERSER